MATRSQGAILLNTIKEVSGGLGPQLVLCVGNPPMAFLRPVATKKISQNNKDVILLSNWRNKYQNSFLTEFEASTSRTSSWLSNVVHEDDCRILFMIYLPDGQTIGYMGIAHIDWDRSYGEADAIVRGEQAPQGLMKATLSVLLAWSQGQLELKEIGIRVLSDNPALEFYKKCGFVETKRVSLSKRTEQGRIVWFEDEKNSDPIRTLVYHRLKKD